MSGIYFLAFYFVSENLTKHIRTINIVIKLKLVQENTNKSSKVFLKLYIQLIFKNQEVEPRFVDRKTA